MKLTLPWVKKEPQPIDVEAIRAEAQAEVLGEVATLMRTNFAVSPMMGAPQLTNHSPYPLYGYDHPIWYSTPQSPQRQPGTIISLETLRRLADNYDVLRDCINHLKREVSSVPIDVKPKDTKDETPATAARCNEALSFFTRRGGLGGFNRRRQHFEFNVIEDLSIIGASCLYFSNSYSGKLLEVLPIDSATIRPRADAFGFPGPGEDLYEQWIEGMMIGSFNADQMSYDGIWPRTWTPYFASPVMWLVNVVNSALRADEWNRAWLTDGNTPDTLIGAPETWTPGQIKEYALYFDAMLSGDTKSRQKAKIVPSGMKMQAQSRKDQDFQQFELWLLRRTCAMMGVQPASIGFAGEQYKVSQEDSMESTSSFGVGTLLDYRKETYDDILERLGYPDLEIVNVNAREEKATERATRNAALIGAGIKTPNEARKDEGLDPDPDGDNLFVSNTLVTLAEAVKPPEPPVETLPGDGKEPPITQPSANTDDDQEQRAALAQWERKAINRVKGGKSASCEFLSDALPLSVVALIGDGLQRCSTADDVRRFFRAAASTTPAEAKERTNWAARLIGEIEELGDE